MDFGLSSFIRRIDTSSNFMLIVINMNTTRAYAMTTRAASAAETRQRILRATFDLSSERLTLEIGLGDVALRSGVSIQTILRHFGSRDALFDALWEFAREEVVEERMAPVGDVRAAVAVIFDHYERRGAWVRMLLRREDIDERARFAAEQGRRVHRAWAEATFAPQLEECPTQEREALVDLIVVATDIYTWTLLRHDRRLDRDVAEDRVHTLMKKILADPKE
jgi:AcrR family transcriptional regulator